MAKAPAKKATIIPATTLATALKAASSIVETRNTIPILSMVRLVASGGSLAITTTNLDIEYRQTIEAEGPSWSACVDAKRLAAMAGAASGDLSLSLDGNILTVKAGRSRWALPALPVDDFPEMPTIQLCAPVDFATSALSKYINRTMWTASTEATKYYLGGVFLNNEAGSARFVATDGHKVASIVSDHAWPDDAPDVIVATLLAKVIAGISSDRVSLAWDGGRLRASADNIVITGKLIDGTYPDYRRVIPDVGDAIQVNVDGLLAAVKRARIASNAKTRKLRLIRADGVLCAKIEGTDGCEGEGELPAQFDGDGEVGINADYLVAMLEAVGTGDVRISQKTPNDPLRFDPVDDTDFIGIVMPMRI